MGGPLPSPPDPPIVDGAERPNGAEPPHNRGAGRPTLLTGWHPGAMIGPANTRTDVRFMRVG